jgi:hypothetical protein
MAEEREEKDLTGDLAIKDESVTEVTGGSASENADAGAHAGAAAFVDGFTSPKRFKSRRFKSRWMKHR